MEPDGVFARYVSLSDLERCGVALRHKGTDLTRTSFVGHALSIRLPYADGIHMTLGFRGSHQEAPVSAVKNLTSYLLTADHAAFTRKRCAYHLAAAPSGKSPRASRREHADHDE